MTTDEPRVFKYGMTGRRAAVLVLLALGALMVFVLALVGVFSGNLSVGVFVAPFAPLLAGALGIVWRRSEMPHVRITDGELTIFRGIDKPPVFWRWEEIDSAKVFEKKSLWVKPMKGGKVPIKLMWIPRELREELVDLVMSRIERSKET